MKKRLILPAMAFVFAIGLSFATESSTADAENDWVGPLGDRTKIEEVNCGIPAEDCEGQFVEDGEKYLIYDTIDSMTPKQGAGLHDEYLIPA